MTGHVSVDELYAFLDKDGDGEVTVLEFMTGLQGLTKKRERRRVSLDMEAKEQEDLSKAELTAVHMRCPASRTTEGMCNADREFNSQLSWRNPEFYQRWGTVGGGYYQPPQSPG